MVGEIETTTKAIQIDIMKERNSTNLIIFVQNHSAPGTNITHDEWNGYNFLDRDDSVWTKEVHNHGDFYWSYISIIHIEQ